MRRFLPRGFSKSSTRLLIGIFSIIGTTYGASVSVQESDVNKILQGPKPRSEVSSENQWNVESLYKSPSVWKETLDAFLRGQLEKGKGPYWPELKEFQGRLGDPQGTRALLDRYFDIQRELEKFYVYAHLRLDEDVGNDLAKHNYGKIGTLLHDYRLETAWIEPELLGLKEEAFQSLLDHPSLAPYRFYLEKMGRARPHTLAPELEELFALSGKALGTSSKAFGALNNADLRFRDAIDGKGNAKPLSPATYLSYLRSNDRELRKTAFSHMHEAYETHVNTLCELLQGQVQAHLYQARAKKFNTCQEAALFPHQVEPKVYANLIASVRKHLPILHEYIALRKQWLEVSELHPYDLYVPLVEEVATEFRYEEARQQVIDSVAPLGREYQASLAKGLTEERWVDVYENLRKRSGAYSSGCYDSFPFILMNYNGTLNDVLTLAHEAGHSMHSLLSRKHQPYVYADYPIFVAEVASTFNEQLLLKHMKERAKSKEELAFLLQYEMEGIRGTIFRQTLFAEFEQQVHKWAEEGVPLTPSLLSQYYLELNRAYYGPELVLDPLLGVEWARIPHFYYNFYVYQYATGLSAALSLFKQVIGSEEKTSRYLEFLSSGSSQYPIDLLKRAGVDMRQTAPVDQALEHFGELLKKFKECLN